MRAAIESRRTMGRRVLDVRPLRVATFARLWAAGWVTAVGSQLTAVVVPLEIYGFTGSSAYVGLASLAGLVPMVVAALWGGALADAVDRRRMLLVTSAGIGVTSVLLWAQAAAGLKSVAVLLPIIAVQQAMFGANAAVGGAVVPRLVPPGLLPAANALQSMSVWFAGIAGPLLAGVLMPLVGARTLFLFDAIAMCPTLWAIARLPALPPAGQATGQATGQAGTARAGRARRRQVADGFGYLVRHQILLVAYVADFVTLFFGLPTALFPQIAHQRFGGPAAGGAVAGALFAAISAGGVVAAVLAGLFSGARRPGAMMAAAACVWGVAIAAFGVTRSLPAALALLVIAGGALLILGVFRKTILQAAAADHMRGRMQGMDLAVAQGGPRLASAAHGLIGAALGATWTVTGGGLLVTASMLVLLAAFPGFARCRAGGATTRPGHAGTTSEQESSAVVQ
jgi:Transmembrane secretion effector